MKKFLLMLMFFSTALLGNTYAQERTVSGKITDGSTGDPIPGANVLEKGTSNGTVTDLDGNYKLSVADGATLVVSFIGFRNQEVAIGARSVVDVILEVDITELSEVVVVGYGSQEKKEITSSVASIQAKDFNAGNVTDPNQLIAGKVAGLSIVTPGGDPNAGSTIRLRGLSTFGANSSPLIVLDGVVGASLDNVDPNDIATIDVLKDGSAAAIYGARGSSGVILVTTKSGKSGGSGTKVSFNGFTTVDMVANKIPVLSASEFVAQGGEDFGSDTDWFDEITQTAVSYTGNLSLSGGDAITNYRASVNYRDNEGVAQGVGFDRINTRLSLNHSAIDGRLRFNINGALNHRNQTAINNEAFRYAVIYNPTAPIFDNLQDDFDGGYFQRDLFDFFNPVALSKQQRFEGERRSLLTNYRVEFDVIDELTLALNYSQDRQSGSDYGVWSKYDRVLGAGQQGIARHSNFENFNELFEATASYNRELIDGLNATFLLGAATQLRNSENFAVQVRQFLFDPLETNNLGFGAIREGNQTDASSFRSKDELNSVFARANFTYNGTYFLSASVRSESFSGFGENEKRGTFPAVSAGVEITELFDLGPVNGLKLRASYGVTGNLPPAADLALLTYGPGNRVDLDGDPLTRNDLFVGTVAARDPNPGLKWETKSEFDIGVDFELFDGKVSGTMDYYTRDIDDLLFNVPVGRGAPSPFGATNPDGSTFFGIAGNAWANIGSLSAGGFEFAANVNNVALGPVSWTPGFNFTIYKRTTIESLGTGDIGFDELRFATPGSPGQNNNPIIRNRVGEDLGNMYGPEFLGIDELGNPVLSSTDPEAWGVIGNGLPEAEFGITNTFTYKNFDLNFFLRGAIGHDLYNSYRGFYEPRDAASNTWNSVDTDLADPRLTGTPTFSDLYVEDATFIRLDNMSFGYNVPMTNNNVISSLRVYAAAQNLFTITDYTGIDPTVRYSDSENGDGFGSNLSPGLERRGTYFTTRSFTLGVTINLK